MKNLLLAAILLLGIASCTPVKYVTIDPKDSTKLVEVRKRIIYDDVYLHTPLYFNFYRTPQYYRAPIIIHQAPIRIPQRSGRGRR
jgi:hypothetical protein